MFVDVGLLVLRVVVGLLLAAHGMQKLVGWFGGPGIEGEIGFLSSLGYRWPRTLAWVHGTAEMAGGLLLAAGLFTPLAVAAIIGVMLNAALAVHAPNGLWVQRNGMEYPLVLGAVAIAIASTGPGRLALDPLIGWNVATLGWAIGAIAAGLLVGLAVFALRGQPEPTEQQQRPGAAARAA